MTKSRQNTRKLFHLDDLINNFNSEIIKKYIVEGNRISYIDENGGELEWRFIDLKTLPPRYLMDLKCDCCDKPINKKEIVLMLDMMMTVWTIHTKCINDNFDSRDIKDFKIIEKP